LVGNRKGLRIGRTVAATILLLAGTLLTMVGILFLWADDTLYNADHLAATTLEAVKERPVRTVLSRTLVDQAVELKPDLLSIRPLLETIVETLVPALNSNGCGISPHGGRATAGRGLPAPPLRMRRGLL
jgi:hypothetical protein